LHAIALGCCRTGASTTVKGRVLAVTTINKMVRNTVFNVVFRDVSDIIRVAVWGEKMIQNYDGKFQVSSSNLT